MDPDPKICKAIVQHLTSRANKHDHLDGIILAVVEAEAKRITEKITRNVGFLLSVGVVKERPGESERSSYELAIEASELDKFLKK